MSTTDNLRILTDAHSQDPGHLPEPSSITVYPHLDSTVMWQVTDSDEFADLYQWLATLGRLSDYNYETGSSRRIVSIRTLGVDWSVALTRESVPA